MPLKKLGDMPIETFLKDYWQKKPLLIRQAYPNYQSPIDGNDLAGLALEDDVESRIILEHGKTPWELRHGPFDEKTFSTLPDSHWTLLVQAVDQWMPDIQALLDDFRFLPSWRLDDVMVSYASDQGSVGPHFDYYDVFLLQAQGKRRWKIGQHCDSNSPRLAGTSLNILEAFHAQDEWVLEPGDILYIPPGVAHWGVAEGECITCSIGFRAPSHADILCELSQDIASRLSNDQRYADPDIQISDAPGQIGSDAIARLRAVLNQHLTDEHLAQWLGKYMSERKYPDSSSEPEEIPGWMDEVQAGTYLLAHPCSRFAYYDQDSETTLFVDGQMQSCPQALAHLLCHAREFSPEQLAPWLENPHGQRVLNNLIAHECLVLDLDEDD